MLDIGKSRFAPRRLMVYARSCGASLWPTTLCGVEMGASGCGGRRPAYQDSAFVAGPSAMIRERILSG